jgi:hypothetical protein
MSAGAGIGRVEPNAVFSWRYLTISDRVPPTIPLDLPQITKW